MQGARREHPRSGADCFARSARRIWETDLQGLGSQTDEQRSSRPKDRLFPYPKSFSFLAMFLPCFLHNAAAGIYEVASKRNCEALDIRAPIWKTASVKQSIVTLDLEGVLVPEIWIAVAEKTGIRELRLT